MQVQHIMNAKIFLRHSNYPLNSFATSLYKVNIQSYTCELHNKPILKYNNFPRCCYYFCKHNSNQLRHEKSTNKF